MSVSPAPQGPAQHPVQRPPRPAAPQLDPDILPDETDLTQIRVSLTAHVRPRRNRAHGAH